MEALLTSHLAAIEKVIYAIGIKEHYEKHLDTGGQPLRIAYVGKAPQISTYEPGLDLAKSEQLPFTVTTNLDKALAWLGVKNI